MTTFSFPIPRLTARVAESPLRRAAVVALTSLAVAAPAAAQAPADSVLRSQQRAIDSLVAVVRALQVRLDSLARLRPDTGASDDLTALRAAAAAAAGPDTVAPTVPSGPRGQSLLNPELTVTGDVRVLLSDPEERTPAFGPHSFEFGLQSALDPLSTAKVIVGVHDDEVEVEEGYVYWAGLPGHLRLDVGRFRQTIGELNRWHLHALPEGEYPLVLQRYLGEEGLTQTGASVYWPVPIPTRFGTYELTAQVTGGSNEALFGPYGEMPSYLGHLSAFWQLSRSVYAQVGVTGLAGEGRDSIGVWEHPCLPPGCPPDSMRGVRIRSRLGVLALRLTWRPPERAQRREVTVRGELYRLQRTIDSDPVMRHGGYLGAQARLSRRWIVGVRGDWVQTTEVAWLRRSELALTPTLTFWQSEYVYLRLHWTRHRDLLGQAGDRIGIQTVWAMGPHKHELY